MMIIGKTYDEERALYAMQDSSVEKCRFAGPADGESALKKMLAIAAEKEFDKITCIDMQERKEERLCVNCMK